MRHAWPHSALSPIVTCSALWDALPSKYAHLYSKVAAVDLSQPDVVTIELDNGEPYTGNLLLAADGCVQLHCKHTEKESSSREAAAGSGQTSL